MPSTAAAPSAAARTRTFAPGLRRWVSQLHWLAGITLGTVLALVGLTGAGLSFRAELLSMLNPGVVFVPPRADAPRLAPGGIGAAVVGTEGARRVATIALYNAPDAAARVVFAARPGETGGETRYADPYTGALRELRGDAAFEWIEALHRWLLLPRADGRIATGVTAIALALFVASGLYLRWPRRASDLREWFALRRGLRGRPLLWAIHAVAATWILPLLLVSALTGIYWSFDTVRDTVDRWAGPSREPRMQRPAEPNASRPGEARAPRSDAAEVRPAAPNWPADLDRAWALFTARVGDGWQTASLRAPERPGQPVQITWLTPDAPYDRARNRMVVDTKAERITRDDRWAALAPGARALTLVYPLHTGNWGLAGRVAMMVSSLGLPLLAITGWMLYLGRRRTQRAARAATRALAATRAAAGAHARPLWVVHASQSGTAERIAVNTASALAAAGQAVEVLPLARLQPEQLPADARVLIVAASFGDGEAPDTSRRFAARFLAPGDAGGLLLGGWQIALLALGDSRYPSFCGFGHALDARLRELGATPLWPLIEVDADDEHALARWQSELQVLAGTPVPLADTAAPAPAWERWTWAGRTLLNPGSEGAPLYEVTLEPPVASTTTTTGTTPAPTAGRHWQAGDLLELRMADSPVPRRYSLASIPSDGAVQLLVRQARNGDRLGLASGWLTQGAVAGDVVEARLIANPAFAGVDAALPCLFIGNGSGLAGLRGHLRERVRLGARRNWLLFGERHRLHDAICAEEIDGWQAAGRLPRLDRVYSRDKPRREYVQDRLRTHADELRAWVADGCVIYVCGSLQGMAGGVDAALRDLLGAQTVEDLLAAGRPAAARRLLSLRPPHQPAR